MISSLILVYDNRVNDKNTLREIECHLAKGNDIPGKNILIFKDVAKEWIDNKKPNLRQSTWSVYEGITKPSENDFLRLHQILMI